MLNGALAGLVGITAGADVFSPLSSVIVGAIAGVVVVYSYNFFDRRKVDDPVGAISVHLVCRIWGTLAVGLFGQLASLEQLISRNRSFYNWVICCNSIIFHTYSNQ